MKAPALISFMPVMTPTLGICLNIMPTGIVLSAVVSITSEMMAEARKT